ncbi:MAG: putative LPS assembly protein LptD, partial [Chitinophagales bacterium]
GKRDAENAYYGDKAYYTTCDLEEPHFYISAKRAKIVPQKIAVTGPANLVIADVPTPLFLPFGIFPIQRGQTSGIIIPQYGYSFTQGYFLRDGGYYFAINDYVDLALTGDIYSNGSWRLETASSYALRYKFRGNVSLEYSLNKYGLDFAPDYSENTGFFIRWNHSQDAKARPNSVFGANVSFGSTNYLQNNAYNQTYLNNAYNSSVSYTKSFSGTPFSLNAALRHSQNTSTGLMDLTLPEVSVNMSRIYPFKKIISNPKNALNQLGINYNLNTKNYIRIQDSLLFSPDTPEKFQNGFSQQINTSAPFKLLKHFTLTPSFSFTENWYFQTIRKSYNPDTLITSIEDPVTGEIFNDTTIQYVQTDTIPGFKAAHFYNLSASLSTKIYGFMYFKRGKIKGFRHMVTPSLAFSYKPDYASPSFGYYGTYQAAPGGEQLTYSIFEGGIYSGPTAGRSGTLSLSIGNNLEMKVFSKKDTVSNEKRIKLIESFSVNSAYNFALDSMNFSIIGLNGYTTLFDKFRINLSASYDPYIIDSAGRRQNQFEWDVNNRLGRFTGGNLSFSTSFRAPRKTNPSLATESGTEAERFMVWDNPQYYIDFNIPWQFNINYNLQVTNISINGGDSLITTQTFNLSGDMNFTPNWKIALSTGYDFELLKFTYTSIDIYRDLHCWEMGFKWIPFGARRSYMFNINVKASVLQDLKLTRKRDWNEYSF